MSLADKTDEELISLANTAEQAERYKDMVECMKELVVRGRQIGDLERNLFSVAYKNVVGACRTSWRYISSIEQHREQKGEDPELARKYRAIIEEELMELCKDVCQLIQKYLLEKADTDEAKVFFHKMIGDYLRYQAEIAVGENRATFVEASREAYNKAKEVAEVLNAKHPIRLGLALNFSVFHYEIENNRESACESAKKAFDDAMEEMGADAKPSDVDKDSMLILQLLRDNLTLWLAEAEEQQDD